MAFAICPVLPQREMTVWEFKAWLKQFDVDRDGQISRDELRQALRSLNTWCAWWKAREGLRVADSNRNGLIDSDDRGEIDKLVTFAQQNLQMKIYVSY